MRTYTDGINTVKARNYKEAAEKLYGQEHYTNPIGSGTIPTTYTFRSNGHADVLVYSAGDKQGSYWGAKQATPRKYTLTIV